MEASSPAATREHAGLSLRKAVTITAAVGALHAILFIASFWLLSDAPRADSTAEEIRDFYGSSGSRSVMLVGLYLMPFAGIAFVWFIVALRMWLERSADQRTALHSNLQLVAGIAYVGLFFVAASAFAVLSAGIAFDDGEVDVSTAREFPVYGSTVLFVFAFRMAAMFVLTTSFIGLRSGALPRWFGWGGYGVAAFLLLSASFQKWFALVFPAWLLVFSVLLLQIARRLDPGDGLPERPRRMPFAWRS